MPVLQAREPFIFSPRATDHSRSRLANELFVLSAERSCLYVFCCDGELTDDYPPDDYPMKNQGRKLYPDYCLECYRKMSGAKCLCGRFYGHAKKKGEIYNGDLPLVKEALPSHIAKDRRRNGI